VWFSLDVAFHIGGGVLTTVLQLQIHYRLPMAGMYSSVLSSGRNYYSVIRVVFIWYLFINLRFQFTFSVYIGSIGNISTRKIK